MQLYRMGMKWRAAGVAATILALTPALACAAQGAAAQTQPSTANMNSEPYRIFHLKNITSHNELNDAVTNLRALLRRAQVYGEFSSRTVSVRGTAEDLQTAEKILAQLDQPQPTYRLTYTITHVVGGKRTGSQSFSLVASDGQRVDFKQGDRIPIVTSATGAVSPSPSSQVQYADVGIKIGSRLEAAADNLLLQTDLEQSSVAESTEHAKDPVIHQTSLSSTAMLTPGKAQVLGTLDVPGSTRQEQIEVTAELVR